MNNFITLLFAVFSFTNFLRVSSLRILTPNQNDTIFANQLMLITWEAVPTDPLSFDIQISNNNSNLYPNGLTNYLKKSQPAYIGYLSISNLSSLVNGSGYEIRFLSMDTSTILSQSPKFNVYNSISNGSGNSYNIKNSSTSGYDQENEASTTFDQSSIYLLLFSALFVLFI
ncbi:uncharacterized protein MELLADRAFT_103209 [Melampsora larici-populina 98AG31]|uniref:Secreted protein n=1 Tax=Melampsora larici-populina (strain 98AG31 / pathotype 3-4-7) TaxID=747676 RepID=F4RAX0_MELLP|nr:uncharacterized protein MELLADRAFT_103209 [Melampsora larici-populina 98AG31]EGG10703.1 secreted protein [Melampsora larici-populina 98AG31]